MIVIWFLSRVFAVIHSASSPSQIAGGVALGMIAGLTPSAVISVVIIVLLILLNINLGAGLISMALFAMIGFLIDPITHDLGFFLLVRVGALQPVWTRLYNTPFVPFSGFNNTVVIGSACLAVTVSLPLYFLVRHAVVMYRTRYALRVRNWPPFKYLRTTELYRWYTHLRGIGERLW